ncbi:hypothetical protein BJ085DRAFT_38170 [Dimargaris cristalligena]|uniref:Uncharacterized protein n=1 Tax=Dimargaris cristalligena TaxID=215637 RepID=A0A4P9ZR24_9FUNG|nr:hypothetical protein BJ085DRAFT_38170 [Dimargaris cristalligena]|eukprot:RKP35956.1 hypothetical protein BJ085DRAFT_38170 [Dimargaris cristalligena]
MKLSPGSIFQRQYAARSLRHAKQQIGKNIPAERKFSPRQYNDHPNRPTTTTTTDPLSQFSTRLAPTPHPAPLSYRRTRPVYSTQSQEAHNLVGILELTAQKEGPAAAEAIVERIQRQSGVQLPLRAYHFFIHFYGRQCRVRDMERWYHRLRQDAEMLRKRTLAEASDNNGSRSNGSGDSGNGAPSQRHHGSRAPSDYSSKRSPLPTTATEASGTASSRSAISSYPSDPAFQPEPEPAREPETPRLAPDHYTYTMLLNGYNRAGCTDKALGIWREFLATGLPIEGPIVAVLLDTLGYHNQPQLLVDFWEREIRPMGRRGGEAGESSGGSSGAPSPSPSDAGPAAETRANEPPPYWQTRPLPKNVYNSYIEALLRLERFDQAVDVFTQDMWPAVTNPRLAYGSVPRPNATTSTTTTTTPIAPPRAVGPGLGLPLPLRPAYQQDGHGSPPEGPSEKTLVTIIPTLRNRRQYPQLRRCLHHIQQHYPASVPLMQFILKSGA